MKPFLSLLLLFSLLASILSAHASSSEVIHPDAQHSVIAGTHAQVSADLKQEQLPLSGTNCPDPCHHGGTHLGHGSFPVANLSVLFAAPERALEFNESYTFFEAPFLSGPRRPPKFLAI